LFRDLIDAISNSYLDVDGVPMKYKSHTSKIVDKSDLVECTIDFYRDKQRGVSVNNKNCELKMRTNNNLLLEYNDNNNFTVNINSND
jgi:hypothetical protein